MPPLLTPWMFLITLGAAVPVVIALAGLRARCAFDGAALVEQVLRLLSAGNRRRAIMLSAAAVGRAAADLCHFALTAALSEHDPDAVPGDGYRDASVKRTLEERARRLLELRRAAELGPIDEWWRWVLVAAVVVTAAGARLVGAGLARWPLVAALAACAWGAALYATWLRARGRRDTALVVERLARHVAADGEATVDPDN